MPKVEKNNGVVVMNIAYRERDHVTLGEDGLRALKLMIRIARRGIRNKAYRKYLKMLPSTLLGEDADWLFSRHFLRNLHYAALALFVPLYAFIEVFILNRKFTVEYWRR